MCFRCRSADPCRRAARSRAPGARNPGGRNARGENPFSPPAPDLGLYGYEAAGWTTTMRNVGVPTVPAPVQCLLLTTGALPIRVTRSPDERAVVAPSKVTAVFGPSERASGCDACLSAFAQWLVRVTSSIRAPD